MTDSGSGSFSECSEVGVWVDDTSGLSGTRSGGGTGDAESIVDEAGISIPFCTRIKCWITCVRLGNTVFVRASSIVQ